MATVSITVAAANDAPVAVAQSLTTAEDTPLVITLSGTDVDGDTLTYSTTAPSSGTLTGSGANVTYTPNADFNGSDTFTFTVSDGSLSDSALVTIVVTASNDVPVLAASPAPISAAEDSGTVTVNLAGMFNDPDGDPLTLSVAGFTNGTLLTPAPTISGATLTMRSRPIRTARRR